MSGAVVNTPTHNTRVRKLSALLDGIVAAAPSVSISGLTLNSRAVQPGWAFVALQGLRSHGLAYVHDAIAAGATVVLWEPPKDGSAPVLPANVVDVCIPDLAAKLGTIADRFFDEPSKSLRIAAVTGTNGKTTTAFVLAAAIEALGVDAAYAGTLGYGRVATVQPRPHTTPDCISVHRELSELLGEGVRSVAMEATSHALDQHRVAGVRFETAVFTNLTRDHLDYHGTLEAYGEAKARLFAWPGLEHAIINIEDAFGRELAARPLAASIIVYGRDAIGEFATAHPHVRFVRAQRVATQPLGLDIDIDSSWGQARLHSRLIGAFNVDNLLAVLSTLLAMGVAFDKAIAAVECASAPPGRMEMLTAPGKPIVLVDYAHTPDALDKALRAVRAHCTGRIWVVFGCGGDRDTGKRPQMGRIAEAGADEVIVTDDNPRTEDGEAIVANILAGMQQPQRARVERDRAAAIRLAISQASAGDVVLIAGKGHEDYQIVGTTTRPFSDREAANAALRVHA
jgi:UDP-N-acetylmuramoyl-L-alanyl-D-glutamate--2,6-diaminopimelate ligase